MRRAASSSACSWAAASVAALLELDPAAALGETVVPAERDVGVVVPLGEAPRCCGCLVMGGVGVVPRVHPVEIIVNTNQPRFIFSRVHVALHLGLSVGPSVGPKYF